MSTAPCTLDTLYAWVFAACARLGPARDGGTGAFATVTDFAGELTEEQLAQAGLRLSLIHI